MKKILFILLSLFLMGCYDGNTHKNDAKPEYPDSIPYKYTKQCRLTGNQYTYGQIGSIKHFDYNGHSYIQFHVCGTHGGSAGVVHDPDCPCHSK